MLSRLCLLLVFLVSSDVFARGNIDFSIHQQFVAPRALGMGNSFSAIDDYNAILYNPAYLARFEKGEINMFIQGGASLDVLDLQSDLDGAEGANESETINNISNVLSEHYGDNYHLRFPSLGFMWARPKWGIAVIPVDLTLNLQVHDAGSPSLGVTAIQDTTFAFGYAWNFLQKKLSVGVTGKAIYRGAYDRSYTAFDLAVNSDFFQPKDVKEGLTIDADVGMLFTPDIPKSGFLSFMNVVKPTFAMVVRNIADYGYLENLNIYTKETNADDEPVRLQRRIDIGSRWDFPELWVFNSNKFVFDVRDIGHRYWTFLKGLHTGVEFNWEVASWFNGGWRAGLNQGYWTLGFTGELAWFHLDLVSYGEEIGTSDVQKENRVYMFKASLDF